MSNRLKVKELWVKMCNHDGLSLESMPEAFSIDNPWADEYYDAVIEYIKEMFEVLPGTTLTWNDDR
jgi:hypothetical protein